ncbi:protein of unknown function [Acetoanaerobium sticklandii]|uniref:Uncharacterized protein n=1 Tax=Acetoanaerobium sticklandii (strain ATCC 12662 / DSM 519 / JCM 1433 / CCUG 9281 / NCIMB 10654 / HF) TaxID=499177 RepID=E3PUK2_ACESD|nr:protein of unknown function [Acetoanaerobium sticklandii]
MQVQARCGQKDPRKLYKNDIVSMAHLRGKSCRENREGQ